MLSRRSRGFDPAASVERPRAQRTPLRQSYPDCSRLVNVAPEKPADRWPAWTDDFHAASHEDKAAVEQPFWAVALLTADEAAGGAA